MTEHHAPDFAHPQTEYEDDCLRSASSPLAAAAGLAFIAVCALGFGVYILARRTGPFLGLLLALVMASAFMGCQTAHTPQRNPHPRSVGMEAELSHPNAGK